MPNPLPSIPVAQASTPVPQASTPVAVFKFDTQALQQSWQDTIRRVVGTEQQLSAQDLQQLDQLSLQLYPIIEQLTQEMLTSSNPEVQRQYIQGLIDTEVSKAAELAGDAIIAQKQLISDQAQKWVQLLANTLLQAASSPILQVLLKAAIVAV